MKLVNKYVVAVFCLLMTLAVAGQSFAWWNEDWQQRLKLDVDSSDTGANISDQLLDVPVLIRLHTGNFDFTMAKEDGSDLRFVTADDKELLKYHFESYDALEELAIVWVKVPKIVGSGQNSFYLYYGNNDAGMAEDVGGTFDVGQKAVFHFGEIAGLPIDSTAYKNNALEFQGGQGLPSLIGRGISMMNFMDSLVLPGTTLSIDKGFTFSTWIRLAQSQSEVPLLRLMKDGIGLQVTLQETAVQTSLYDGQDNYQTDYAGDLTLGSWHHLAVSGVSEGQLKVLVDGSVVASVELPAQIAEITAEPVIGDGALNSSFAGEIDEVRFSSTIRSPDWLMFAAKNQAPGSAIVNLGMVEVNSAAASQISYMAIIARNISMDGWFVIGILVIISALSWFVIFAKSYIFYTMEKGNKMFRASFDRLSQHHSFENEEDEFGSSPLYRIYQDGYHIMHGDEQIGSVGKIDLNDHEEWSKTFQFAIERSYMYESQRLNSWLTIMTLAISGGPFLGLLGTVWGVMNTFAALAEAGEANIMAIAPGIASALATTVFGLIVAIPALFGYNFLVGKIKAISQDLNIFLDEYALKINKMNGKN